jgi:type II secretion system (T2SS) protein M
MIESTGARLHSVQALPDRITDQLHLVGARVDFQGSLQAVQRAVYAV